MEDTISVISIQNSSPPKELEKETETGKEEKAKVLSNDVSYWNLLYILAISVGSVLATSIVTLIPRHNTIFYPEFWYEPMILFVFTICLRFSILTIAELYVLTKIEDLLSIKVFLKSLFGYSLSFVLPYCICYATWTVALSRNHPLPFIGYSGIPTIYLSSFVAACYLFSPETRAANEIKAIIPYLILHRISVFFVGLGVIVLKIILQILSRVEWIAAILIPIFRSSSSWVMSKIVDKITGHNNEAANSSVTSYTSYIYGFYIANGLFSAKQSTIYCILSVEFVLHMRNCYQIIRLSGKIKETPTTSTKDNFNREKQQKVFELASTELIETLIPLVYGLGYALAYFGPNAHLMKNIGSNWFGGKVMKDIQYFYQLMILLFTIDLIGMILTGACLYQFCKLNVLQEICKVLKKYWWMIMLQLNAIATFLGTNDINFALDFTGNFQWITDDGRNDLIRNSSELTQDEKAKLLQNMTLA